MEVIRQPQSQARHLISDPSHRLADAKSSDDDWTGLKDAAERRKRQNRLNVRAHRRRKAEQAKVPIQKHDLTPPSQEESRNETTQLLCRTPKLPLNRTDLTLSQRLRWDQRDLIAQTFTLPADTRLLTLIHYNVLRAFATNMSLLNLYSLIFADCSKGNGEILQLFPTPTDATPDSLLPTPLQQQTPHERWIDLMPVPRMRDNAIRWTGRFSARDLCEDMVGGLYPNFDPARVENNGFLVWADPWDVSGWEVTAGFVRKWGFLLEGCHDVVAATNAWRALRDEEPLIWEV